MVGKGSLMKTQRLLRPVDTPLALYLRPGRNDHLTLSQIVTERSAPIRGVVFDPCLHDRQSDLSAEARGAGMETVLDPRSVDLSTVGGIQKPGVSGLPWAAKQLHNPENLHDGTSQRAYADVLAEYVVQNNFTAVLSPTHLLRDSGDPWLPLDLSLTRRLREALDARAAFETPIYYPLALAGKSFRESGHRNRIRESLYSLPIDAVWLRIFPFGSSHSGPVALRGYIHACHDLHSLDLPLVAEHSGTVGLALAAFGAVGGIESGITTGENFDAGPLLRPRKNGKPFLPQPRIYVAPLGAFLARDKAQSFFSHPRMKTLFGCKSSACCRRGFIDTLLYPKRHFILSRAGELANLSRIPLTLRHKTYLEEFLRPATDRAMGAARVAPSLEPQRRRLESWRGTLGALEREGMVRSWSRAPRGKKIRRRLTA